MPLGVVSDAEFELEAAKITEAANNLVVRHQDIPVAGRGHVKEIPAEIRAIIAEEAIQGTPAKQISELFGVSQASVSAYKHDATSTSSYDKPDKDLKQRNDAVRDLIVGTARTRLIDALKHITPEKLGSAKVRDLAAVAKDMSQVISNTQPSNPNTNIGAQFVFHVPKARKESEFEVIDVNG